MEKRRTWVGRDFRWWNQGARPQCTGASPWRSWVSVKPRAAAHGPSSKDGGISKGMEGGQNEQLSPLLGNWGIINGVYKGVSEFSGNYER